MAVNPKKEDWMPRCEFCSFFEVEKKDDLGFCHRNPPALINLGDDNYETVFPILARDEWCGEFHRLTN